MLICQFEIFKKKKIQYLCFQHKKKDKNSFDMILLLPSLQLKPQAKRPYWPYPFYPALI